MNRTRSGEAVSVQIGKMGKIFTNKDFQLPAGQTFNIKNEENEPVILEVQLGQMEDGETVETLFDVGWNPEIVKVLKKPSQPYDLKWGY